ncbi:MAG: aldolase/citrate lyase family protein [Elusimicrobiota bacterium]|nr:aldolase/citrate lyase family protein [Elusimicrobiota bacterium]
MTLKDKLRKGVPTIGTWLTLAHPALAEMAARAGFDWVAVDLEHSSITLRECEDLIRVIDLAEGTPLVRLTSNDPDLIKRVMDSGARGVIVPTVSTEEEAQLAVEAVYYPPRGRRGVGLARAHGYGADFAGYMKRLAKEAVVVAMIETAQGVENAERILGVDGVDAYFLGPYDLSASLGVIGKTSHPKVEKAIAKVRAAGKRTGKPGGIHVVEPDPAALKRRIKEGFRFVAYSLETRIYDVNVRAALRAAR